MAVVRVVLSGTLFNQLCQNVLHFEDTDAFLSLPDCVAEIETYWLQYFRAYQMMSYRWTDISAGFVGDASSPFHKPVVYFGQSATDDSAQSFSCIKFRIHTPVGGRSGRGRIYITGMSTVYNWTNGLLNQGALDKMNIVIGNITSRYIGLSSAGPLTLGILGKKKPPSAFIVADAISVSPTAGVLRRRNVGVGS